jgi:hypothetical protein
MTGSNKELINMSNFLKPLRSLTAMCAVLSMLGVVQAQNEATVYVLKLNESNISSLRSSGNPLRSTIPEANRGKINAIVIGTAENPNAAAIRLDGKIEFSGNDAVVKMDDAMLDEIRKQPVRLDAGKNSFGQVLIRYQPAFDQLTETSRVAAEDASVDTSKTETGGNAPDQKMFFVSLDDNETLRGEINGLDAFKIKCGFGEITVPLDQVSGIRFHTDPSDSAVVVLKNGDSLTGIPIVDAIKITTFWGHAEVVPEHMQSITTRENASFAQETTDFGTRWELRAAIPTDPRPTSAGSN